MNYWDFEFVKECYCSEKLSTEQKVEEMGKRFPQLTNIYADDLKTIFTGKLPLAKGVEIKTRFGDKNPCCYVAVTKMPEEISVDVQKAIMRVGACLGGFKIEKWGIGYPNTEAIKRHLSEYLREHAVQYIPGEAAGYPKVLEISSNEVDGASNECYLVSEITGIILS